ncbi:hypothetical protein NKG95_33710 [Mesorhizobium sp. M1423]
MPDVYQYDTIPEPLRVQIVQILKDAIEIAESRRQAVAAVIERRSAK